MQPAESLKAFKVYSLPNHIDLSLGFWFHFLIIFLGVFASKRSYAFGILLSSKNEVYNR